MSFRKNESHQMTLNDSYFGLTEREKKALEKSWAKVFADDVFPMIDEDRFECLYSSDKASRPNTPVNVIIGALIIRKGHAADDCSVHAQSQDRPYCR